MPGGVRPPLGPRPRPRATDLRALADFGFFAAGSGSLRAAVLTGEQVAESGPAAQLAQGGQAPQRLQSDHGEVIAGWASLPALHWSIARWLAERGIDWYDLGDGFGGLWQFKQGFVGKSGAMLAAVEFDRALTPQARAVGTAMYRARDVAVMLRRWHSRMHRLVGAWRSRASD